MKPFLLTVCVVFWPLLSASAQERVPVSESDLDAAKKMIPSVGSATYDLDLSDHVNGKGKLVQHPKEKEKDQLNCTTFASPVLHILVNGGFEGFVQSKVNGYGDSVAKFYGLESSGKWKVEDFKKKADTSEWRKENAGVFYFDARRGGDGHVGFLVVSESKIRQVHFSGMEKYQGLADDDGFLSHFLAHSRYSKDSTISLYRVTRPKKK